ncbi:MAG: hypothetical protein MUP99_00995, partial [Pedobacter sp.]|nr:hypothetical protein [Pedobacter sp.]
MKRRSQAYSRSVAFIGTHLKQLALSPFFLLSLHLSAQTNKANAQQTEWHVIKDKILTPWAEKVNPKAPLPEYPRPQLVRNNNWKNLNGLWQYAIVPKTVA